MLEKSLKRFLKRKLKITLGVIVTFLITGAFGYAEEQEQKFIPKSKDTEVLLFLNANFSKFKNEKIKDIGSFTFADEEIKPPVDPDQNPTPPDPTPELEITENSGIIENFENYGMTATTDKGVLNKGTINADSDITADRDGNLNKIVAGIYNNGGTATNDTNGIVNVTGNIDVELDGTKDVIKTGEGYGVYQTSGTFENKGTINIAGNGYDVDKDGTIDINGGYGVFIEGGTAVNTGKILSEDSTLTSNGGLLLKRGIGMAAIGGIIENGEGGLIKNQAISLYAKDNGIAINNGIIETEQTGILALDGGTAENNGIINAWKKEYTGHAPEAGTGLYASSFNGQETTIHNTKKGVVYGSVKAEGTAATIVNDGTIYGTEIKLNGGNIVNNGTITGIETQPGTVITGTGKFIQGAEGKLIAERVDTNIYASGEMAANNYSNIITQKDSLDIKEFNGELRSNSAMYKATKNGNDIVLSRKNFAEIVDNKEFSNFLENNYKDGNLLKTELFNNLKKIDTNKEFNRATNSLFGNNLYPNLKKQTLEMISFNKDVLQNNVFSSKTDKELRVIGGLDYKNFDTKSSNLSGYEQDIKAVFLGADKKVSDTVRLGTILNIGNLKADYDMDNAEREDAFIQANFYSLYNKDEFELVNNLFMGLASGEIERDLKVVDINEHYKGDIDSKWVGLQNIASYKLDMDYFYVKPKLEANFTYLIQDSIEEKGNYALTADKENVFSFEAGIGAEIGKDIFLYNGGKLTVKAFGNVYQEFADPYNEIEVKMKNVSGDTIKVSDYDEDTRVEIGVKAELELKNNIKTYAEYKHTFEDEKNGVQFGINYKF